MQSSAERMQMSSRVRRSWQLLVGQLDGRDFAERRSIDVLRTWLRESPGSVSTLAADAIRRATGIELVLREDPARLPISCRAADAFSAALRREVPVDPRAYVAFVDRLCWELAVYHHVECPDCDGELELWTDGAASFESCNALGCCFDVHGTQLPKHAAACAEVVVVALSSAGFGYRLRRPRPLPGSDPKCAQVRFGRALISDDSLSRKGLGRVFWYCFVSR